MLLASRGAVARNAAQPPKMHTKEVCPSVTSAGVESPALRVRPLFISSIEDVKAAGKTATPDNLRTPKGMCVSMLPTISN